MKYSTRLLKFGLILIGLPMAVFAGYLVYLLFSPPFNATYNHLLNPIVSVMLITALPFFYALKQIKQSAIKVAVLYTVIWPLVYGVAEIDDAPGLVLVGGLPIFGSIIIAVFSALLQTLLTQAIEMKQENDLTI